MHEQWKQFLIDAGAEFDDGTVAHFGNLRRELSVAITGNVFADLSHYGLISVHGEDAAGFLQAQLSNDINAVNETHSQLNGYCNPKGRLLATMRVFRRADSYYLCLPAVLVEPIMKRLQMYVLRAKVTLEDASDTFVHVGVSGSDVEQELGRVISSLPENVNDVTQTDETVKIRVPGIHPSFEVFTTTDHARTLWNALNVRGAPVGKEAWTLLDILAGIPIILPETSEAFVPQMVNLQLIDAVSFKKGCYPGQEIVARMQYLGKLKRRMYGARVDADERPAPGSEIFTGQADSQPVGKVVLAASHPDGDYALLVVIQISAAGGNLHLGSHHGPALTLTELPYPFPAEETG